MKLFKRRDWTKWEDVTLLTESGKYRLLQCRTDRISGKKQFVQRSMGWVNEFSVVHKILKFLSKNDDTI